MKRMGEFPNITAEVTDDGRTVILSGSVRVRVDLAALAAQLGPKALSARGSRIQLQNGAVVVEAFGVKETDKLQPEDIQPAVGGPGPLGIAHG